jgi:kynurenine formamidase
LARSKFIILDLIDYVVTDLAKMNFNQYKFFDLTHTLDSSIPSWTGACGFTNEIVLDYHQGLRTQKIVMDGGIGTHMDAPSHFYKNAPSISDLPLESLMPPLCIIDCSQKSSPDFQIGLKDLEDFETKYGKVPNNSVIVGSTGWEKFWKSPEKYRQVDSRGKMHFPTFSPECGDFFLDREIAGIGIDTLSPDRDGSDFPLHHLLLKRGKYIIENLAGLAKVPPSGATLLTLPMKIANGSEAPIRAIALLN